MIPSESCIETSKERTLRLIYHGLSKMMMMMKKFVEYVLENTYIVLSRIFPVIITINPPSAPSYMMIAIKMIIKRYHMIKVIKICGFTVCVFAAQVFKQFSVLASGKGYLSDGLFTVVGLLSDRLLFTT